MTSAPTKRTRKPRMRWIGRRVRLKGDVRNLWGRAFKAGTEVKVYADDGHRKGLGVVDPDDPKRRMRGIAVTDVELIGPPPEKSVVRMDDWIGRRVRLWTTIKARGGAEFKAGEVMIVEGHWRGRLHLKREADLSKPGWQQGYIRQVPESDVELI